jgi:predicted phosphodiesterase
MSTYHIEIIGAIGAHPMFQAPQVLALLQQEATDLSHGAAFTGRPGTRIYADAHAVCKIHAELNLDPRSARRWVEQALQKEKNLALYHPSKTWFIATDPTQPSAPPLIGNICARLEPLHIVLHSKKAAETGLTYLSALFDHYLRVAVQHKLRLDEGLSNFGVDEHGAVFYLDDDAYNWDRFISCAHMLGVYFRSLAWLSQTQAEDLGTIINHLIGKYFNDAQYTMVLAEQLRDIFMPSQAQQARLHAFVNALTLHRIERLEVGVEYQHGRYLALLADIHANYPALHESLAFLRDKNIDSGIVLGDIVGYGPYPSECIECLRETRLMIVKGNHDHGLATGNYRKGFSKTATWALAWSEAHVNAEQRAWLEDLPPVLHGDGWHAMHGAPVDPTFFNAYVYEMTYERNLDFMEEKKLPLCFHGHTHLQGIYARKPGHSDRHYHATEIALSEFSHALICPGSIGQPRDYRSGAQFAIYDRERHAVEFHVIPYDTEKTIHKMETEDFPQTLINILRNTHAH